jgi:glutamate synthase domain-containing protein 1
VFFTARERRALGTFLFPRGRVKEMTGIVEDTLYSTGWTACSGVACRSASSVSIATSTRTVIYKGLLSPAELPTFYPDLREPAFAAPFAVVQRKISAAAPLWSMASPLHTLAHSGELRHDAINCA